MSETLRQIGEKAKQLRAEDSLNASLRHHEGLSIKETTDKLTAIGPLPMDSHGIAEYQQLQSEAANKAERNRSNLRFKLSWDSRRLAELEEQKEQIDVSSRAHYKENEAAYHDLAVIEAHLGGVAINVEHPVKVGQKVEAHNSDQQ